MPTAVVLIKREGVGVEGGFCSCISVYSAQQRIRKLNNNLFVNENPKMAAFWNGAPCSLVEVY
jgi:hypothetical protein